MKPTLCFLFILIFLLPLMVPGKTEYSLDSLVDQKIKEALKHQESKTIYCTSVTTSGRLASCPAGTVVTGCACGYGCGSWDIQNENTCHCQCSVMDWATARCCKIA
ncbi:resistin-like beta [Apodemus sylvaticus]|uniref:resistin-like beta n=1 Tax=Apodemus sylvaticus TaxID=10129 RepID=UPI002244740C|nr:resistin-like beta [Apodemus sylvaticus]XP_052014577.1 resistin-like beta [Apodemus sylvaticus]